VQVPIISGIYTDGGPDVRKALPRNLIPVGQSSGVSEGYLRPADGIVAASVGPGIDRGGIYFSGAHVRVIGRAICIVDAAGNITPVGEIGGTAPVTFAYDTTRLAVCGGGEVFFLSRTFDGWEVERLRGLYEFVPFPPAAPSPPTFVPPDDPPPPPPIPGPGFGEPGDVFVP
jgi:hypothetical protein